MSCAVLKMLKDSPILASRFRREESADVPTSRRSIEAAILKIPLNHSTSWRHLP
jgi:hypothetical protein